MTIDGVPLARNEIRDEGDGTQFAINLIPPTHTVTKFGNLAPWRSVNIEIDMLARDLQRMEDYSAKAG